MGCIQWDKIESIFQVLAFCLTNLWKYEHEGKNCISYFLYHWNAHGKTRGNTVNYAISSGKVPDVSEDIANNYLQDSTRRVSRAAMRLIGVTADGMSASRWWWLWLAPATAVGHPLWRKVVCPLSEATVFVYATSLYIHRLCTHTHTHTRARGS
jgi:hypothetical protein